MNIKRILNIMKNDEEVAIALNQDIISLERYVPKLEELVHSLIKNLQCDEDVLLLETMSFLHILIIDNRQRREMNKNKFFKQAELN